MIKFSKLLDYLNPLRFFMLDQFKEMNVHILSLEDEIKRLYQANLLIMDELKELTSENNKLGTDNNSLAATLYRTQEKLAKVRGLSTEAVQAEGRIDAARRRFLIG